MKTSTERSGAAAARGKESLALVSLGCAKNAVDLQVLAGGMLKQGFVLSPDPGRADVVVVNTCAFIESAREEAEAEIRRALALRARGRYGRVVVAGCYPQRYPEALAKFPGVDVWQGVPADWQEPAVPGLRLTGKAFAYLKIAEGCSHHCAYCAIPSIRGRFRSRPADAVVREAKALLATGCRELNIVAQDPMMYGVDMPPSVRTDLVGLLRRLDRLRGDFWIRVLYSYPSEIDERFISWMATSRHAARYIDVPIQHTDAAVLARMNRRHAVAASRGAAEALRAALPGVTLRTTVMTGFPGETERRFRQMLDDLDRMRFDRVGAFAYSPEKGTAAAKMPGRPSRAVAEAREKAVMTQAARHWKESAAKQLGRTFRALVVAPGVARMESQAPDVDGVVLLDSCPDIGEFVDVTLRKVRGFDFEGQISLAR